MWIFFNSVCRIPSLQSVKWIKVKVLVEMTAQVLPAIIWRGQSWHFTKVHPSSPVMLALQRPERWKTQYGYTCTAVLVFKTGRSVLDALGIHTFIPSPVIGVETQRSNLSCDKAPLDHSMEVGIFQEGELPLWKHVMVSLQGLMVIFWCNIIKDRWRQKNVLCSKDANKLKKKEDNYNQV